MLSYWKRPPWQIVGTVCKRADTVLAQVKTSLLWSSSALSWCYTCEHHRTKKWHDCSSDYVKGKYGTRKFWLFIWPRFTDHQDLTRKMWRLFFSKFCDTFPLFSSQVIHQQSQSVALSRFLRFPPELSSSTLRHDRASDTTSATYQNSFSYLKVPEKRGKPISCWCNHTPFDCHNFGACFYLDMT